MARLWSWIDEREPVTTLALFRIAIGLIVVSTVLDVWLSGAAPLLWYPAEDGGIGGMRPDWRVALLGGPSVESARTLSLFVALSGLALSLGLLTRLSALVAGQSFIALASLQPGTDGGHDRLITNALWLLVLSPAGRSLSLDGRLWRGTWTDPAPRVAWPRRLLAWQLVVTYGVTGWQKLGAEWWPWGGYTAVYRSLLQPAWARFDLAPWLGYLFPITQLMTAITMLWECGFPVIVLWWWARRRHHPFGRWPVRAILLGTGLLMHGILLLTANLGPFPLVTVAYYLCFFGVASEVDQPTETSSTSKTSVEFGGMAPGNPREP